MTSWKNRLTNTNNLHVRTVSELMSKTAKNTDTIHCYLQSTLMVLVFLMAPLTDILLFKYWLLRLGFGAANNDDFAESDFMRCSSKYCCTCGFNSKKSKSERTPIETDSHLLSGRPSSWQPKKLKFAIELVLKKSFRLPRVTLVPFM